MNSIRAGNRVACAFVGLLAGNVALLLFLLQNAVRIRADLLAMHMGEPGRQIPLALEMWALYAPFSFVGWLFVGVPIALLFPAIYQALVVDAKGICRRCRWPPCPVLDLRTD